MPDLRTEGMYFLKVTVSPSSFKRTFASYKRMFLLLPLTYFQFHFSAPTHNVWQRLCEGISRERRIFLWVNISAIKNSMLSSPSRIFLLSFCQPPSHATRFSDGQFRPVSRRRNTNNSSWTAVMNMISPIFKDVRECKHHSRDISEVTAVAIIN